MMTDAAARPWPCPGRSRLGSVFLQLASPAAARLPSTQPPRPRLSSWLSGETGRIHTSTPKNARVVQLLPRKINSTPTAPPPPARSCLCMYFADWSVVACGCVRAVEKNVRGKGAVRILLTRVSSYPCQVRSL